MNSRKNRFISGFLSFLMVFTLVIQILPPIKVSAAAPTSTFPNKTETMYIGEEYDFTGKATYNSSKIDVVHVDIQGPDTQTVGVSYYREEDLNKTSFSYGSYIDSFTWGDTLYSCQSSASMKTNEPGKYWIIVYTKALDGTTTTRTHIINLEEPEPEPPTSTFPNKTETMYIGETYDFSGKATANGADIDVVQVDIQGPDTQTIGVSYYREEDIGDSSYYYSDIDSFEWGETLYSYKGSASMKTSEPGKYWIIVYTKDENGDTTTRTHIINLEEPEEDYPSVDSISASTSSVNTATNVTFTVKTNTKATYGVQIYADEYYLGTVTSKTTYSSYLKYTYKHQFYTNGSKTIYAYPIDEDGDIDKSEGASCKITVNAANGVCGSPTITTTNGIQIGTDESIKITWTKPSKPTSGVKYNVYLLDEDGNNVIINTTPTTSTSYTIPASAFSGEGTYVVSVYAVAAGYTQSKPGTINVIVANTPSVDSITASTTSVNTATNVTFTIKTNTKATYGVQIYADEYYLGTVTSKTTYSSYLKYTYTHQFYTNGTKKVYAYPMDSKGNIDKSAGASCTVTVNAANGVCGSPTITTTNGTIIGTDESIKITWTKPSKPTSGVKYNVYLLDEDGNNVIVNTTPTTSTSYTIPASAFSGEGTYVVSVYAVASGYTQSEPGTINVIVSDNPENDEAQIIDIIPDNDPVSVGKKVIYNIKTNTSTYGVQLYVKDNNGDIHNLGTITTVENKTSTMKVFIAEYTFNSTGLIEDGIYVTNTRRICAYPIDANGNVIEDDSVGSYYDITVTPADYTLSNFTVYDTEVELGESATISWSAASAETNDTVYYNVYIGTKTSSILLTPNKTSSRSITVDSSLIKEIGSGTYAVMVIATAANHGQKQVAANITIIANAESTDTTKPMINPISSSADPIIYGTSVTFSTAASDETALDKVEMYVDSSLAKTVSAADTYANISYTTDSLSEGVHTILVKAYDDAGNYNSWSQSFTVKKVSSGIVYDVELSDYDFYAGSYITFTVKTSTDTTKIRLVDGSYVFSVQTSGYKDSGGYRIWTFEQYVGTVGTDRTLNVESYSGGWTGNYWTTDPFTVRKNIEDVGDFVILSPDSGSKHQFNTTLTVTWSEPEVEPDWYVVNVSGVPSGSDLISISGNTAVIDGSVFDEYDTYAISVTAQKEGYNQSEAYVNVTVGCLHEDRTQVGVKYGSETYYSDSKHKVTVTPKYLCNTCGGTFTDTSEAYTEYSEHNHDVELDNSGWFCDCGYVDSGSYTPWTGYLQSNSKEKAYSRVMSDGELTNWDGVSRVYPDDTITVVGTKFDAFLIKYSLSSGGTKTRFVDRTLVDRTEYTGREIVYISIDGVDLRCVQEGNGVLYAAAYDFAAALNGSCSFISNNKLNCRMKVYDTVSALNYYWAIDLRNYSPSANWTNIDAYTDESLTTLSKADFAGAYVYGGDINISINGVLELLSYKEVGENAYSKKDIDYDLIKTAQAIRDADGEFQRVYRLMTSGMLFGEFSTYAYSIAKFDVNGLTDKIVNNVANSSGDVVEAIKQSLLATRTEEDAIEAYDVLKLFFEISDKTAKGVDWTVKTSHEIVVSTLENKIKDLTAEIQKLKEAGGEVDTTKLDKLNKELANETAAFDGYNESVSSVGLWLDSIGLGLKYFETGKCTFDQLYTAGLLAQNYDSNMEYLDRLIANTDSVYMKKVYQNVRSELKSHYSNIVTGYFSTITENPNTRGAIFDLATDAAKFVYDVYADDYAKLHGGKTPLMDFLEKKLGKQGTAGGGYLLAHAAVAAAADIAFKGEDIYGAASQLYNAADIIPEMVEEVNSAIKQYRNNPSSGNRNNLIFTAKNLANYRIITLDACKKYQDSLVIDAFLFKEEHSIDIKRIENEKTKITNLMNSLN